MTFRPAGKTASIFSSSFFRVALALVSSYLISPFRPRGTFPSSCHITCTFIWNYISLTASFSCWRIRTLPPFRSTFFTIVVSCCVYIYIYFFVSFAPHLPQESRFLRCFESLYFYGSNVFSAVLPLSRHRLKNESMKYSRILSFYCSCGINSAISILNVSISNAYFIHYQVRTHSLNISKFHVSQVCKCDSWDF